MAFQLVYEGPVSIFYKPNAKRNTCVMHGDKSRVFESIRDGVTWAAAEGLVSDPDAVINKAESKAAYWDRLED